MYAKIVFSIVFLVPLTIIAQSSGGYFQQKADYTMNLRLEDSKNLITGTSEIIYTNNSPDTLHKLYFHTYWNAFQKNSAMDFRTRYITKGDNRRKTMETLFKNLKPEEEGSQEVKNIIVNGAKGTAKSYGTILEITLSSPILPHSKNTVTLDFQAKIPILIRRTGRDNKDGIAYSIAQWYPKICNYDRQGWHTTFYIGREFYGIFGNFKVAVTADKSYIVTAGAILDTVINTPDTKTWHFHADNVHDLMWAADKGYQYFYSDIPNTRIKLGFFYKPQNDKKQKEWIILQDIILKAYPFIEKYFGPYPYPSYNFIQGGDGGMEYLMGTLIHSPNASTAIHEWLHSWFQGALASNESQYAWLDEGFTNYAESKISSIVNPSKAQKKYPLHNIADYYSYYNFIKKKQYTEEPMTTFADYYEHDVNYTMGSYIKGSIFLSQLGYLVADSIRDSILKTYIQTWQFHHPKPDDFIRIAEKISGLQLKWYQNFWTASSKTIDYAIDSVTKNDNSYSVTLHRKGHIPMPIDLIIYYADSTKENHYIPLDLMMGEKTINEYPNSTHITEKIWTWTNPNYTFSIPLKKTPIVKIIIDPSERMADIDRTDNISNDIK